MSSTRCVGRHANSCGSRKQGLLVEASRSPEPNLVIVDRRGARRGDVIFVMTHLQRSWGKEVAQGYVKTCGSASGAGKQPIHAATLHGSGNCELPVLATSAGPS